MGIGIICFTKTGYETGKRLLAMYEAKGEFVTLGIQSQHVADQTLVSNPEGAGTAGRKVDSLKKWTQKHWNLDHTLIFIGASGIAVRAIAPYVKDKRMDPAVLVIDEVGQFCIPLLSGHLGGANTAAREIANQLQMTAVITTATDIQGIFAIDEYGNQHQMNLKDKVAAKHISAGLLAGEPVVTVGVGCRKGTTKEQLEEAVLSVLRKLQIPVVCVRTVASIDLKKEEPGILQLCEKYQWKFQTFSKTQLEAMKGDFTSSVFVKEQTGVENVCERSALCASQKGILVQKKLIVEHVTVAVAIDSERNQI